MDMLLLSQDQMGKTERLLSMDDILFDSYVADTCTFYIKDKSYFPFFFAFEL